MKKILVVCGAGVATSTVAINKLKEELEKRGLLNKVTIAQATITQLPDMADNFDLIVTTSNFTQNINKPVVKGLSFITNVGKEKTVDEIIKILQL
ncbi:MAG: system, galactitol-specific component [Caloramator sp.]|jgi:PTS system galactitol-specific IIB component|uniref:PTS sugar transporter subunit IIB n=1 Tax=Caloramator sp. TaxID=1871330 RepID=UPI001D291C0C|nr:PTS sugar transporter subunit IIB [Caloramator sp.]MBZ4663592.1 system, galactitol-specific component [Caloramator sp.]